MGVAETADGYINIGVGGDKQWRSLCEAMDLPDLGGDERYATAEQRAECRAEIWAVLRPVFRQKTSEEWLAALEEHSVPAGPIYRMDEMFADPQVRHLGMAQPVDHHARGRVEIVGQPVTLNRTPARLYAATPEAGEHTDEVLSEIGLSSDEIADLRAADAV